MPFVIPLSSLLSMFLYVHVYCCKWHQSIVFMAKQYSILCMQYILFIHSSVIGHLGCLHLLAIVNSAALTLGCMDFYEFRVFSKYVPRSGFAGSYGNALFSFLRSLHTVCYSGCTNLYSNNVRGFPFLHILSICHLMMAILTHVR